MLFSFCAIIQYNFLNLNFNHIRNNLALKNFHVNKMRIRNKIRVLTLKWPSKYIFPVFDFEKNSVN